MQKVLMSVLEAVLSLISDQLRDTVGSIDII